MGIGRAKQQRPFPGFALKHAVFMFISVFCIAFVKSDLRQPTPGSCLAMAGALAVLFGGRNDIAGGKRENVFGESAGLPQIVLRACA